MKERMLKFAMKIGGDYRVFPNQNAWPEAARELALDTDALVGRVRELAALAPTSLPILSRPQTSKPWVAPCRLVWST